MEDQARLQKVKNW